MTTFNPGLWLYVSVAIVVLGYPLYHFFYWLLGVIPGALTSIRETVEHCADAQPMVEQLDDVRAEKAVAEMNKCVLTMREQVLKHQIKKRVANRGKQ